MNTVPSFNICLLSCAPFFGVQNDKRFHRSVSSLEFVTKFSIV